MINKPNNTHMKIIQNYLSSNEFEYQKDYTDMQDAIKTINEYEKEDIELGQCHSYTIVDDNYDDVMEVQKDIFDNMAINAMQGIGLTHDEAIMQLQDIK